MDEVVKSVGPGGPAIVLGGALGWLLNWLRMRRKDAYTEIKEATQELINTQNNTIKIQGERILQLEGRIEQLTAQMRLDLAEGAKTAADLAVANATIARLEAEVAEWERRWNERFPTTKESL